MWFRTPQCSGHRKDFGSFFFFLAVTWQCQVFSWHSWKFLAFMDLPEEFFHTIPEHSRWEAQPETLTQHCSSATKAHRDRKRISCASPCAQVEVSALQSV